MFLMIEVPPYAWSCPLLCLHDAMVSPRASCAAFVDGDGEGAAAQARVRHQDMPHTATQARVLLDCKEMAVRPMVLQQS